MGAQFGEHACIDTVGLADDAHRPGEVARLPGRLMRLKRTCADFERVTQLVIVAATGFEHDPEVSLPGATGSEGTYCRVRVVDPCRPVAGMVDVEPNLLATSTPTKIWSVDDPLSCPGGMREHPLLTVQADDQWRERLPIRQAGTETQEARGIPSAGGA